MLTLIFDNRATPLAVLSSTVLPLECLNDHMGPGRFHRTGLILLSFYFLVRFSLIFLFVPLCCIKLATRQVFTARLTQYTTVSCCIVSTIPGLSYGVSLNSVNSAKTPMFIHSSRTLHRDGQTHGKVIQWRGGALT